MWCSNKWSDGSVTLYVDGNSLATDLRFPSIIIKNQLHTISELCSISLQTDWLRQSHFETAPGWPGPRVLGNKFASSLCTAAIITIRAAVANHCFPRCESLSKHHTVIYDGQATVRDLRKMGRSQIIQVKSKKGINDKCQKEKNGEADWCTAREGWDITGDAGTKTTSQRERTTWRLMRRWEVDGVQAVRASSLNSAVSDE